MISETGVLARHWLDQGSWVDIGRGWLPHPEELYTALRDGVYWRQSRVWRYDHYWDEPRLSALVRPGPAAPHPVVTELHKRLRRHYGVEFMTAIALSYYRDGRDAMAPHRDSDLRHCESTVTAILSLGATRPWLLSPRRGGAAVFDVSPGSGDLLVMGGRAQLDWLHGVPRVQVPTGGRISVQWRWTSGTGRPEVGGSSGAPRHYGGGR
ncbi:MAG: putative alkylated repair protein [Frankiales bacterium]|nr:putative alkylated repair protein [Frankiales bacterium]